MLKRNSKRTLDVFAGQKKKNATEAYLKTHPNATRETARIQSSILMNKPEAQIYLKQHVNMATETIVDLLGDDKPDIRLRSAQDILDRSHGKATQKTETTSNVVTLNLSLSDLTK